MEARTGIGADGRIATRHCTYKGSGCPPSPAPRAAASPAVRIAYPPNFDPKKKWPLLHSIHGGPHAAHLDAWHFRWNVQVFPGHGYVVAAVSYHGSSGFRQKLLEMITGRYGEKEFADVEVGTDWLLRQGCVDRARLVCFPDENHWILKPQNSRLRYREFFDWVARFAPAGPARRKNG